MERVLSRTQILPLLSGVLLVLAGCASSPPPRTPIAPGVPSTPATVLPTRPPDVNQIPDAIPRVEARSPYGNPPFYDVNGHRYVVLNNAAGYTERGVASWYGTEFNGLRTSTGESYDMFAMTAAHKTLPLPCYARVTNLTNGRSVVVRINDRGPFVGNRIIDLSYSAAAKLDMIRTGTAFVQVEVLTPGTNPPSIALPVTVPAAAAAGAGVSTVPPVTAPLPDAPTVNGSPASQPDSGSPTPAPAANTPGTVNPSPDARAGAGAPGGATFYIQVGAYAQLDNAQRTAQRLREAGIAGVLTLTADAAHPLQRVRIGPITSVQQFDSLIARLNQLGFTAARLAQD